MHSLMSKCQCSMLICLECISPAVRLKRQEQRHNADARLKISSTRMYKSASGSTKACVLTSKAKGEHEGGSGNVDADANYVDGHLRLRQPPS